MNDAPGVLDRATGEILRIATPRGVLTRRQMEEAGLSPWAITQLTRRGDLVAAMRGVFLLAGQPATVPTWAEVAVLASGCGSCASHLTALALWGLRKFPFGPDNRPGESLHVTRTGGRNQRPGVVVHHTSILPEHHVTIVDGVPCTSVARTLLDLTAMEGGGSAASLGKQALRRGLCSADDLRRVANDVRNTRKPFRKFRIFANGARGWPTEPWKPTMPRIDPDSDEHYEDDDWEPPEGQ